MPKLTDQMKKDYIANKGRNCPFCGSAAMNADRLDFGSEVVTSNVTCLKCHKQWVDLFTLTGIEQREKPYGN